MACCTVATAANRAARRSSSAINSVVNELHRHRPGYDTRLDAFVEEKANGTAAALAVIERPVVDIHSYESVGFVAVEAPGVPHRVIQRVLAVVEAVGNALAEMARHLPLKVGWHVLPNDVAAQGKRKSGLLQPPRSHVSDEMKTVVLVSELSLMNEETRVNFTVEHSAIDLIERYDDRNKIGLKEFEREIRARHQSRDSDALTGDALACHRLFGDEHRPISISHRSAVRQQSVAVGEICICVNRDRRHI